MPEIQRISIAIDPALAAPYAPEIAWTWRYLLGGAGYAWEERPIGDQCDIAYTADPARAPKARIIIQAAPQAWEQRVSRRLAGVGVADGCEFPLYAGEQAPDRLFHEELQHITVGRDLIFDIFWLLTGQEEPLLPKNKHGHLQLAGTPYLQQNALRLALASGIGVRLEQLFQQAGMPPGLSRWPYGKRAAAAVSHDVDYPEVIRWLEPLRVVLRQGVRGLPAAIDVLVGRRHHWQFNRWLELERSLNTHSAFYFVARQGSLREYATGLPDPFYDIDAPQFRALFRMLADAGCEIGLHGSYSAYASSERFASEKQRLEEAAGVPVIGHRHHYWHMDPGNPEATLAIHEQIGFQYDASLANDEYLGWRRGSSWPFFPLLQRERRELRTLQLPTGWMDSQIFLRHEVNPGDPRQSLQALADRTAHQGGLFLINIHDYVFDELLFPGWVDSFRQLWRYVVGRGDFWAATPAAIATHWRERHQQLANASVGLNGT